MGQGEGLPPLSHLLIPCSSAASIRQTFPYFDRLYALGSDDSQYLPYDERIQAEDHWRPCKARAAFRDAAELAELEDAMEGERASPWSLER